MIIEIKIPSPGESISEVELASWFVENGDLVTKDQELGEVESEKATLPLIADQSGKVEILAEPGQALKVGFVACKIDTSVEVKAENTIDNSNKTQDKEIKNEASEVKASAPKEAIEKKSDNIKATPVAKKMMEEEGVNVEEIINGLRKLTASDVKRVLENPSPEQSLLSKKTISRDVEKKPLSQLRKKISERLVAVKNETAMLTTFNEVDMSAVMELRKKYQKTFVETHEVKLGFMSFFTKAVSLALQQFPNVNSFLDGNEMISPQYCDVGIAVQTDKGLVVPVLRNAETLGLAEIEKQILDIAGRARKNRLSMEELSGGTFTITNGGIFGSMLSTPILNPPQSGILGMHNILERPIAINGEVAIRPMMYIALSYDHRVIDGRDSVGFLKTVKEYIENPVKMLFEGTDMENILLNL